MTRPVQIVPADRAAWLDPLGFSVALDEATDAAGATVAPRLTAPSAARLGAVLDHAHGLPDPARGFELRLILSALGDAAAARGAADPERVADAWEEQAEAAARKPAARREAARYAKGAALRAAALA